MARRLVPYGYSCCLKRSDWNIIAPAFSTSSTTSNNSYDNHRSLIKNKPLFSSESSLQKAKYSAGVVEAEQQQSSDMSGDSNGNSNGASGNGKKKYDFSESRERHNKIRFFYSDPEIDKAAEKPLVRLNPMTMFYMGVSYDNSHLLQSANYLRNELPIRLAHLIKEFRNLPFIISCNPSMLEIHERCIRTFRDFDNFDKEIKDINTEKKFNQLVFEMLEMNKDLLALLCDGFKDSRRYIKNEEFIKTNLNKILSARLGIRLLCEHHIALNKQSSLNKILLADNLKEDEPSNDNDQHDNFNSSYLSGDANGNGGSNGNNGNGNSIKDANMVGIVNKKFSPKRLVETAGRMVTRICMDKYGVSPKIKIDGHTNAQFPYIPLPIEYILPELLKNSFRATYEHHKFSQSLPDVNITIAVNEKDFIIRIRDRGGGIPHSLVNKIFDYHFTTASDDVSKSNANETHVSPDPFNSAFSMICEAQSSRGLAVMHGYGFGLPTSKAYAEYLGGSLTFQTMLGIGSDFYLRLGRLDVEAETVRI